MPLCLICHEAIEPDEKYHNCPNGHPAHARCLQEWMTSSDVCPLCTEKYAPNVLAEYTGYLEGLKRKEEQKILAKIELDLTEQINKAAEEVRELQQLEKIHDLHKLKEFEKALQYLFTMMDSDNQNAHVLFLIGKTFYLKEQFDLAINYFMKLVKKNYDYPEAFFYLGKAYEAIGIPDKANWAYERMPEKRNPSSSI